MPYPAPTVVAALALALAAVAAVRADAQAPADAAQAPMAAAARERLDIKTGRCGAAPKRLRYVVELAADRATRRRGLQHRRHLPADSGMLFLWPGSAKRAMWMKDTLIPLDMLFLATDGRILAIEPSRAPHSERVVSPRVAARAVLELLGGTAERQGICPGDQVISKRFDPAAAPSLSPPSPF